MTLACKAVGTAVYRMSLSKSLDLHGVITVLDVALVIEIDEVTEILKERIPAVCV